LAAFNATVRVTKVLVFLTNAILFDNKTMSTTKNRLPGTIVAQKFVTKALQHAANLALFVSSTVLLFV
jgi:hypothetical protein